MKPVKYLPAFSIKIMILFLLVPESRCLAQEAAAVKEDVKHSEKQVSESYGSGSGFILNFYQHYVSPIKGGNKCPMYPSCSQYSKMAFQEHSFLTAYAMTFDRLMRCGHELDNYPGKNVSGYLYWYDPVGQEDEKGDHSDLQSEAGQQPGITVNSDSIANGFKGLDDSFASSLFGQGDFSRASIEYLRLRFYETDTIKKVSYLFKSALCDYNAGNYNGFISFADKNRNYFLKYPSWNTELEYYLARSYYELKAYNKAIASFDEAELNGAEGKLKEEIDFYRGLSYARLFFWNEAARNMAKVKNSSSNSVAAKRLLCALPEAENLTSLSPFFAGFASTIIPGSGYLYAHRTGTAITSFVINSLLVWTVYSAMKKDNYSLAALTFFFGSGWYIGNIYGSSQAARDYNTRIRNEFIDQHINTN